jgi:multidrug resistance protein
MMMTGVDKKVFAALFFSIFTAVIGVGIVVPLLPIYAESLGSSGVYIGLVFASFSISRSFLLPLFGYWSDRTGRKPYIFIGLLGYTLVSAAFIFSDSVAGLIGIRFFQGIASAMVMPVVQAYIGDMAPINKEGSVMGLFNLSMFTGLSIGPLVGGLINDVAGMDAAFLCMGVLTLGGAMMSFFLLPPVRQEKAVRRREKAPTALTRLIRDRTLHGIVLLRFVYVFCIGVIWCFLPIMSKDFGLSTTAIGFLIMLGVFTSGVFQVPLGRVADRVNKPRMAILGGLVVAADVLTYQWAGGFWGLVAASIGFGLGGGITMPPLMAMVVIKGNATGSMGSVMSLLTLAHSLGMMFGALSAGFIMDFFSIQQSFQVASLIMLGGTGLFAWSLSAEKASNC